VVTPDYLPDPETMGLAEEIADLNKATPDFENPLSFDELTSIDDEILDWEE